MMQNTGYTVLLIEADRSLQRLIALGLEHRGMRVLEASFTTDIPVASPDDCVARINESSSLKAIVASQQPDVIVLDVDSEVGSNHALLATIHAQPDLSSLPIVVLSWDCLLPMESHQNSSEERITCLTKPFDARTLLATIEHIQNASTATSAVSKQEALLAAHSVSSAPSIWPLITAVGLLLSFIGLMTQITISVLGLLVIMVALLWWTIGTRREGEPLAIEMSKV
jgi:CheY-like chemotaxis protein